MKKVALITGASSGMGKSTANILHSQGYTVYGAAQRTDEMNDLKAKGMGVVSLDLTNDASIVEAVNTILNKEGRIDILVNNAGYGSYGSVEDVPLDEARRQFEVNLFGMAIKDHVNNFIIEKAKILLLSEAETVSSIAYNLGFNYPHYFGRLFKSKTGLTPQEYRKLN